MGRAGMWCSPPGEGSEAMAFKIQELFPPKDLLDGVGDVETRLRNRQRLGPVGWAAVLYTALQAALLISRAVDERGGTWASAWTWVVLGAVFLLLLAVALVAWYYFWLRESRQPFRFTYCVEGFEPFPGSAKPQVSRMEYLAHDLSDRLADRIDRLRRLEEDQAASARAGPSREWESHVHVRGTYELRDVPPWKTLPGQREGRFLIVTPWIRVGAPGVPETRAHPVTIELTAKTDGRAAGATEIPGSVELQRSEYERLLNWLYFHVASEIYKRIRSDVERRIALLPRRRLRVAAYLREAEDYATSPTFDGYCDAADLYELALLETDVTARPLPESRLQHDVHLQLIDLDKGWTLARRWLARRVWSRFARADLVAARAEVGYARATVNRQILAMLSGRRHVLVALARTRAKTAVDRLMALPADERTRRALFEARTELALAWHRLDYPCEANAEVRQARETDPLAAATDQRFLLAAALDEANPRKARERFERAVEASRRGDEIAQYLYAEAWELVWRGRLCDDLDPTGARAICDAYRTVLALNPGNLSAWTSLGYVNWLVGAPDDAQLAFERGLDYKEIQTETYVAELDYGLARKLAEEGRFTHAYDHLSKAASAIVSSEMVYGRGSGFHGLEPGDIDPVLGRRRLLGGLNSFMFFDHVGPAMLRRFEEYVATIERLAASPLPDDPGVQPYMRDVVLAWALTDYAQAAEAFFRRTGDRRWRERARESLRRALDLDPKQWLARYALYSLTADSFAGTSSGGRSSTKAGEERHDIDYLVELNRLVPQWVRPQLEALRRDRSSENLSEQVRRLLPHGWLRTSKDGTIDYPAVLRRVDYELEHRWEKEFEDPHVQALEVWALRYPDMVASGAGAQDDTAEVLRRVFLHVRSHFRADWDMLYHLPELALTYDWLRRWYLRDPDSWERIQWIWILYKRKRDLSTGPAPEKASVIDRLLPRELRPGEVIDLLREVLRSTNWARPAVYRWLAYAFWRLREDARADGLEADERNAATARLEAMVRSAVTESEWRLAAHIDAARVVAGEGVRWRDWHLRPEDYWRMREALLREQDPSEGRAQARRLQAGLALVDLTSFVEDRRWHAPRPAVPPPAAAPLLPQRAELSPGWPAASADAPCDMERPRVSVRLPHRPGAGIDHTAAQQVRAELERQIVERMRLIGLGGRLDVEVGGSDNNVTVFCGRTGERAEAPVWPSSGRGDGRGLVRRVMDAVDRDPKVLVSAEQVSAYHQALLRWERRDVGQGPRPEAELPFTKAQLGAALCWLVHRGVPVRDPLSIRDLLAGVQGGGRPPEKALSDALESAYCRRRSRLIWLVVNPGEFASICSGDWHGLPGRPRPGILKLLRMATPPFWPALVGGLRVTASRDVEEGTYRVVINDHVGIHVPHDPKRLDTTLPDVLFQQRELVIGVDDVERLLGEHLKQAPAVVRSLLANRSLAEITRTMRTHPGAGVVASGARFAHLDQVAARQMLRAWPRRRSRSSRVPS